MLHDDFQSNSKKNTQDKEMTTERSKYRQIVGNVPLCLSPNVATPHEQ